jgi:hypothetical protein
MFMAHDPQIPSLQDLLKVSVGSTSFLILINASRTWTEGFNDGRLSKRRGGAELTMGPHWLRSIVYDCSLGAVAGSSGFCSLRLGGGNAVANRD